MIIYAGLWTSSWVNSLFSTQGSHWWLGLLNHLTSTSILIKSPGGWLGENAKFWLIEGDFNSVNNLLSYWFRAISVSKCILKRLSSMYASFFFHSGEPHKLFLIPWSKTIMSKDRGGIDLCHITSFNSKYKNQNYKVCPSKKHLCLLNGAHPNIGLYGIDSHSGTLLS